MKTTDLLERIQSRTKKIQEEKVENLWNDFLQSVEKVSNKLSDQELSEITMISIKYFLKGGKIFRSKEAIAAHYVICKDVEYEKEDVCLGTKEDLAITFSIFSEEISQDENIKSDDFDVDELFECLNETGEALLDFVLHN